VIPIKDDNPTRTVPFVTVTLIILNCVLYLYQMMLSPEMEWVLVRKYGVVPFEITHLIDLRPEISFPIVFTLLTSQFLHGSLFHVGGNMLYLWIFGNNIEDILGHFRFLIFYLICGIIAGLVHIITQTDSLVPTIGASGAISGVLGAYLIRFPRARVLVVFFFFFFIRLVYVPAIIVLGFWIFIQVFSGLGSLGGQGGGVAWFAHIGGFFAGMILLKAFVRRRQHWRILE
jgi:membrane associated rhomboid family serine protease